MCFALFADNKYSKDQKNEEETTSKNWNSLNLLPCCIKKTTVIFMVGEIMHFCFLNPTVEDINLIPLLSWLSSPTKSCLKQHNYCKILKISAGLIFFKGHFWGAYFWRGLCKVGNLCYKIYWLASRWKANKKKIKCYCTVFVCFTLYLREVSKNKPSGAYTWRGDLAGFFF